MLGLRVTYLLENKVRILHSKAHGEPDLKPPPLSLVYVGKYCVMSVAMRTILSEQSSYLLLAFGQSQSPFHSELSQVSAPIKTSVKI